MHCPAALWLQSHELLLQQGASLDGSKSSVEQAAVLCTAVFDGNLPLLRRLLTAGVSVDAGDYGAQRVAVLGENARSLIDGTKTCIECGRLHTDPYCPVCGSTGQPLRPSHTTDQRTALHISAAEGNLQAVRLLVEEGGADIEGESARGNIGRACLCVSILMIFGTCSCTAGVPKILCVLPLSCCTCSAGPLG